jgi:DNA-binding winged helix-turn-helix (wHTH) protein/Tol biopolymer transport system component
LSDPNLPVRHSFVIGDWRVEPEAGRLVRGDVERRLRPQVMDLLVALASRPGEVFSKQELLDAVWGGRFVSESALTTAVGELRDALEDDAKEPRFVQTVPKRGYRLLADVMPDDVEAAPGIVEPPPIATAPPPPTAPQIAAAPQTVTPIALPPAMTPAFKPEPKRHTRFWTLTAALIIIVAFLAGAAGWRTDSARASAPPPIEVPISLTPGEEPARTIQMTALSPDGRTLVYAVDSSAGRPLMRRDLETREVLPVPGTEGAASPFFSPDGAWIGFWQNGAYRRIPAHGGGADRSEMIVSARMPFCAAWRENGDLVYSPTNLTGLLLLPAGEHTARALADPNPATQEISLRWPEALPDSRFVLFFVHGRQSPGIYAIDLTTGDRHPVVLGASLARFAAPDRLVYAQGRALMAAPFDPRTAAITGPAIELAHGLAYYPLNTLAQFSVSATGVLAYLTEPTRIDRELVLVDRTGHATPLGAPARPYIHPRVSPDGTQIALWLEADDAPDTADVWTYDLAGRQLTRRTTGGVSWRPVWSPDGQRLAYDARPSDTVNVFTLRLSPGATPEPLMRRDRPQMAEDWLPDGHTLVMSQVEPDTGRDLYLVNVDTRETHPLAHETGDEGGTAVSPSGRWIAYVWGDFNSAGIYAVSTSTQTDHPSPVRLIARGREPRWSRDGRELFFRDRGVMYSLRITEANGTLTAGQPIALFHDEFEGRPLPRANYDVMPDGRFLMIRRVDTHAPQAIILSLNWRDRQDKSLSFTVSRQPQAQPSR